MTSPHPRDPPPQNLCLNPLDWCRPETGKQASGSKERRGSKEQNKGQSQILLLSEENKVMEGECETVVSTGRNVFVRC